MFHRAKKSLGQNFLKSGSALKKMVSLPNISSTDTVLEIGPGKGALTKVLLETGCRVIAVEKDDSLIPILQETFATELSSGKLILVHTDILDFNLQTFKLKAYTYKIVANIPYYITGLLIRHFLESNTPPESMTILVQKEVAERIVARDNKESILSLSVKVYGTPVYGGVVHKRYFTPIPKVDSAILHIKDISKKNFAQITEKAFFDLIHIGFAHKRKTLINNLGEKYSKKIIEVFLTQQKLDLRIRPENLTLSQWLQLTLDSH